MIDNCPECGAKMEFGAVQGWRGIAWISGPRSLTIFGKDFRFLHSLWKNPKFLAARCRECKVVVFKYARD